jgi:DNA primase
MDGDEAGRRATAKLKKALSSAAIVWAMHMFDGKDVNDITKQEFDTLYAERD